MGANLLVANASALIEGTLLTLALVCAALPLAALLAVPLTIGLGSRSRMIRWPIHAYLAFFRGSPLIAQLFLVYYGAGQFRPTLESLGIWWVFRDAFPCAVLTFALNSAAYTTVLVRGAIDAVPKGQIEAARALGLPSGRIARHVVVPQAARLAFPGYGNEVVLMIKASALATVITLFDLMGTLRLVYSKTFDLTIFVWGALIYILLIGTFRTVAHLVERRLFCWPKV